MNTRVQCGVTAGVAIVGASVLAVAPLTLPMPPQASPVTASVELSAVSDPLQAAIILAQGLAESGIRAGSGAALTPLSPVLAGTALAFGDNARAYSVIRQSIDAPLWAADPTINALAQVLPGPIGGGEGDNTSPETGDGALVQFRDNVLWANTNALREQVADALGEQASLNDNPAADLGEGLGESALRFAEGAAIAPLGLIPIAQAIAGGDEEQLYLAIRQYIDAPLWVADPTIEGLAKALPAPLGGGLPDEEPGAPGEDGAVVQFRDNVLWRATFNTREPIRKALGVPEGTGDASLLGNLQVKSGTGVLNSEQSDDALLAVTGKESGSTAGSGTSANPRPVSTAVKAVNNEIKAAADRFERRVEKLKAAVDKKATNSPE